MSEPVVVRKAAPGDVRTIYELSNQRSVREASFSSDQIDWSEHVKWFEAVLADPCHGFYVAETGGVIVGQIRFRLAGKCATVSVSIDPRYRRGNVGTRLFHGALAAFGAHHPLEEVVARIKKRNMESVAFFRRMGFEPHSSETINGEEAVVMVSRPGEAGSTP